LFLKQYYLGCLAHASYLIGDEQTQNAIVVDPQRDIGQYLTDADAQGLTIRHVVFTHMHAAKTEYASVPMGDDDENAFGQVRLVFLHTPGHSPDSSCMLVYDLSQSTDKPHAVLTGDTLLLGDVGRPDLRASPGLTAEDLGAMLYDSLHEKLMQRVPDDALQPMEKDDFIRIVSADQPEAPDYFSYDVLMNAKEHQTLDESLEESLKPLDLDEVLALRDGNAQILDVARRRQLRRRASDGEYQRRSRWQIRHVGRRLADARSPDRPIVLLAPPGAGEREASHIPDSTHIPLQQLHKQVGELPRDRPIIVHCAGGYRSTIAGSVLMHHGFEQVMDLVGGITAWEAAGLQTAA
jgi:hydroxyacylglutathione hydrolase